MRASIYVRKNELRSYLERKGYILVTLRKILIKDFGYKTGRDFCSSFQHLSPSILNISVAYKTREDYENILFIVSLVIKYLKELELSSTKYYVGRDIIFKSIENNEGIYGWSERGSNSIYWYTETTVFRREFLEDMQEKTQINGLTLSI